MLRDTTHPTFCPSAKQQGFFLYSFLIKFTIYTLIKLAAVAHLSLSNTNLTDYKSNIVTETLGKRGTSARDLFLIKSDFKIELKEPAEPPNPNPYH